MKLTKRQLRRIIREEYKRLIREGIGPDNNSHFKTLDASALNNDTFIPAGTLEDILEIDGYREFREELGMMCEMLYNKDQAFFVMEPSVHIFIRNNMLDLAEDGDEDMDMWLTASGFEKVYIDDAEYIKWTMRP